MALSLSASHMQVNVCGDTGEEKFSQNVDILAVFLRLRLVLCAQVEEISARVITIPIELRLD
jgi:hypothetical protein